MKKYVTILVVLFLCLASHAQKIDEIALNTRYVSSNTSDSLVKLFSNSEPKGITFLVSTNLRENTLFIKTNYTGIYNVKFIDYWGHNSIEFREVSDDLIVDLDDFERNFFVMNISDERNKKLISSQIINLKKKFY